MVGNKLNRLLVSVTLLGLHGATELNVSIVSLSRVDMKTLFIPLFLDIHLFSMLNCCYIHYLPSGIEARSVASDQMLDPLWVVPTFPLGTI